MVEAAETDIVGSTVTGDNPLRTCHDEALELDYGLAGIATASLAEGNKLVVHLAGNACAVGSGEPLLGKLLDFVGAHRAFGSLLHKHGKTLTDFFGSDLHAEAKFCEVLEQRVGYAGP